MPQARRARRLRRHAQGLRLRRPDNVAYGLIMQELERGDSGLRSFASVQSGLVMYPIHAYGSDAQKDQLAARGSSSGEGSAASASPSPTTARIPGGMKTRAVRKADGGYVLNGTKLWITNGSIADVAVVWAKERRRRDRRLPGREGHAGLRRPSTSTASSRCAPRSRRSSRSRTARFPRRTSCPSVKGLRGPLGCLTQARYGIAWGAVGAAMALLRLGAAVLAAAHPVRQAHRLVPARAAEARVDDHRDHQGPAARASSSAASRTPARCGPSRSPWPR